MKVDVDSETSSLESFEPWDPKFRCCCGAVHVKQGTLIIGIVTGVLIFYSIITIPIALGVSDYTTFFRPRTDEGWFLLDVLFEHERDSQRPVEYDERAIKVAGMFTAVSCSFALILSTWFLKVVWKCYSYFKACNRSRRFLDEHEERRYLPIEFE
ncbi:hypothetical protein M3Y98_01155500 [Aphelenchoides besseyi]|nr:hypothetical protein M3Y98_01155500 [Aphelenchoides besseyi]